MENKYIDENVLQIKTATSKSIHSETREVTDSFLLDFEVFVSKQNTVFSKIIYVLIRL